MSRWQRVIQSDNEKINSIEAMKFISFINEFDFSNTDKNQDDSIPLDSEEKAKIILEQANTDAENIIADAKLDADEIKRKAHQFGYEEGQRSALNLVNETLENFSQILTNAINEIAEIKNEIISNAENDIIKLTIAIAEKLACHELEQRTDFIIELVKESIKIAKSGDEIILKINPNDRINLEKNSKELIDFARLATFNENLKLIIEDDSEISSGDCIVITDKNIFDMTFKSRLDSIIETINSYMLKTELSNITVS